MRTPVSTVLVLALALVLCGVALQAQPEVTRTKAAPQFGDDNAHRGRWMVVVDGPITQEVIDQLSAYGKVRGYLDRYGMVAINPRGKRARAAIEALPFVEFMEKDRPRYPTAVGTWDRDILDVTDVEETVPVQDPADTDEREVGFTGEGVHVAVIDSGLVKRWRAVLDPNKVRTDLARAFMGGGATAENFVPVNEFNTSNPTNLWERDTSSHGTSVASHVIGFNFFGFDIDGVAPDAKVIPLKVFPNGEAFTWSSRIIAAIAYTTQLKLDGVIGPTVINMSLGGGVPTTLERIAIQDAIAAGVIVVASAGNRGEAGMGWPGAFPEVISAGAVAWTQEFSIGGGFWWRLDVGNDPDGAGPLTEDQEVYVASFSSRARPDRGQELDVLAPGQFTVAPCLFSGAGRGNLTFCFWSGTSFSSPLTAGVAALMLDKNPAMTQGMVEAKMKGTALPMLANDSRVSAAFGPVSWDSNCGGFLCDPVGAGLLQADAALGP